MSEEKKQDVVKPDEPKLSYKKINGKHCAVLPHGTVINESSDKSRIQYEIARWNGEETF